jgi:DNA polymerase-3 subunit delta
VKIKPAEIDRFIKQPPAPVRAAVIYGPDLGLVRERGGLLLRALTDTPDDPFSVADLEEQTLKGDPARLADEAGAVAMFGGRRVVRVRDAGEASAKALASYLDQPGDGFVILEAGELTPRSALRKLAESAKDAAALPCYADTAENLERLAGTMLREAGLDIDHAVLVALVDQLGADRQLSRNEIEKLILYKGGESPVTMEDIAASVGGADARGLDDAIDSAAGGDMQKLDMSFARLVESGVAPERMIRALTMHLQRLHLVLGRVERGGRLDEIVRSLRPPLHFSRQPALRRQCAVWSRRRLDGALAMLADAEAQCRGAGPLSEAIVARSMMSIARAAAAGRRS